MIDVTGAPCIFAPQPGLPHIFSDQYVLGEHVTLCVYCSQRAEVVIAQFEKQNRRSS